jgi:hypothetical protein
MRRLSVLLASVVMALTLIAVAAGGSAAQTPPPPAKKGFYGVAYYSFQNETAYWGVGASKNSANYAAYNECVARAFDCKAENNVWVYNGGVAIVLNDDGETWLNWDITKEDAASGALADCEQAGVPGCDVSQTFETKLDPDTTEPTRGGYQLPKPV